MRAFKDDVYNFLGELKELLNKYPVKDWKEAFDDFISFGNFFYPGLYSNAVDEAEKIRDILDMCSRILDSVKEVI